MSVNMTASVFLRNNKYNTLANINLIKCIKKSPQSDVTFSTKADLHKY